MKPKLSLLIPIQWYHPGFRAGGITQATKRLAEGLSEHYQIYILTTNRDHSSDVPYSGILPDVWLQTKESINIKYLSPQKTSSHYISTEIKVLRPDVIYLKSMFNPLFSLLPLWLEYRGLTKANLIIAPSGMLKESALFYNNWKKEPLLSLIRLSRFYKKIKWHATDEQEQRDIQKQFGKEAKIYLLPEFPPRLIEKKLRRIKRKGKLKLLYLSRVHPVKNLSFLLRILASVQSPVHLTIGGPIENVSYMADCQKLINQLPTHINVRYIGEVVHKKVNELFYQHDVFVLPSKGEGFGNVILEALSNACPVIISDQTPWKNLQKCFAGWDINLNQSETFVHAIETFGKMDQETYSYYQKGSLMYAKKVMNRVQLIQRYNNLFTEK
ncbi:MAG: glycosyltransferase involved in cell wall biosynthesis [Saprospiraceae bacterium]|jgi:glycosyltransferase involved in cell wall biosynthesis